MHARGKRMVELALLRQGKKLNNTMLKPDENNNETEESENDLLDFDDDVKDPDFLPPKRKRDSSTSDGSDLEETNEKSKLFQPLSLTKEQELVAIQTEDNNPNEMPNCLACDETLEFSDDPESVESLPESKETSSISVTDLRKLGLENGQHVLNEQIEQPTLQNPKRNPVSCEQRGHASLHVQISQPILVNEQITSQTVFTTTIGQPLFEGQKRQSDLNPELGQAILNGQIRQPVLNEQMLEEELVIDHEEVITVRDNEKDRIRQEIEQSTKVEKLRNKRLRMTGLKYKGVVRAEDGKKHYSMDRHERILEESKCSGKCRKGVGGRKCSQIDQRTRETIFDLFWRMMDWEQKKVYVLGLIDRCEVKRRSKDPAESKKKDSYKYHLKSNDERVLVCRNMFLSTLGLSEKMVYRWMKEGNSGIPTSLPVAEQLQPRRHVPTSPALDHARQYLIELPKVPSHYCRASSTKQYLEPLFLTLTDLYSEYGKKMREDQKPMLQNTQFVKVFHELNLSLYKPKKDLCDICCGHEVGTVSDEEYNQHIIRKDEARGSKDMDKERAKNEKNLKVLTVDLQSLLVCPKLNASCLYYKMKLSCHNFTIFDLATRSVMNYFWHECDGELTANIFTTCLLDYLSKIYCHEIDHVIIYSDGCGYQNRNVTLANALLKFACDHNITIEQKYLERGHTQMECDSVHSVIERSLKKKPIYIPQHYVESIQSARKTVPYDIKYVDYTFFKDFASVGKYSSIRPGIGVGAETVSDIRSLKYKDGIIMYKTKLSSDYQEIPKPRKKSTVENDIPKSLYSRQLPLKWNKFQHLQQIKSVIPKDYHAFYDNLPHCRGRWVYEVMLGSKGVMQLGWCTINCKFSQEEGVGDTKDSYAYDGSRQRKWNGTTQKYGECWYTGDVITCTIDCDNGTIGFYRNGKFLGTAFDTVKLGTGFAYFPAVSLSQNENLRVNFGATPLRYPVEGYYPLQSPPTADIIKTTMLLGYLEKILTISVEKDQERKSEDSCVVGSEASTPQWSETPTTQSTLLLITAHIFDKLAPLLKNTYVIESCLMPLFIRLNDITVIHGEQTSIIKLLNYMWAFMQSFEIKGCIENLMVSLLSSYRFSPSSTNFRHPKMYLTLVLAILRHTPTRKYLLEHELFDKVRFPMFLHIKPLDDTRLEEVTPTVWWDMETHILNVSEEENVTREISAEEKSRKDRYVKSCEQLRIRIEELESIQVEILKVLMNHKDLNDGKTSRILFLERFRKFLRENLASMLNIWPHHVCLCFFHRMVRALRFYWDSFQKEDPGRFVLSEEAFLPIQEFWSDSRDYFQFTRCGGQMSHLNKKLGAEVNKAQGLKVAEDGGIEKVDGAEEDSYPPTEMPSGNSLMDILDGVMLLYHIAAHKQLGKMNSLRDNMHEFVQSYKDTEKKLESCPIEMTEVRDELVRAKSVFLEKITEQARQMSWVRAAVYSRQKQQDVAWVLRTAMRTVQKASRFRMLFQYMPEFYLDICMHSYNALKNYFHPTVPFDSLPDYHDIVKSFALFLVSHFADTRIILSDTRDNITQALACFTCYEYSLKALENLDQDIRNHFLKCLIAPYQERSWVQTNWILVRIWKGCGFGFRYSHLPHLVPTKVQLTEFGTASLQKPCPSLKFQEQLVELLNTNSEAATKFLDSLLNQLNWSFSEFIGMIQEIQQAISRSERRLFLENRQLKICGTCFEISVCLFRVIEMVVSILPSLLSDYSQSSAELLMNRLIQLICLVLNRVTLKNGMFDNVVSLYITGLESVTHFPILAVITGILVKLILKTDSKCQSLVTNILLSDAGFKIESLEFMLGTNVTEDLAAAAILPGKKEKNFDFRNYKEISAEELQSVKDLIDHMTIKKETFVRQERHINEEELCNICYANQQTTVFKPCGHKSCRSCIHHQLLIKKECFFCKAIINSIEDDSGQQILELSPDK